jgi:hypothetical protein
MGKGIMRGVGHFVNAGANSTVYAGFLDTIQPMDCGERDGLKTMYAEAVKGWTEVDPSRQNDAKVVAAWDKVAKAEQAVIDHRKAHGC